MLLFLNLVFGLVPLVVLAWSIAADERKPAADRVVVTEGDRSRHATMFALVYGLWALTLAMWNWFRGAPAGWSILWAGAGVAALAYAWWSRRR